MLAVSAVGVDPARPLGGLEVGQRPSPNPPDGWINVQVRAASVNHHDLWTLRGVGVDPDRLPIILGCDAAGTARDGREVIVHAVISSADAADDQEGELLDPGLSVLSERHDGTMAEWVAVPERNLVEKPPELSFEEAACLPTAYLTAYRALFTQAGLKRGHSVLVQGAGGGLATAAVVLGAAGGLEVFVTGRREERRERAVALGAAGAFPPGARLPKRVDAVLESVGEDTWEHSIRALRPGGTMVVVGATSGARPVLDLQRVFYRQVRIIGSLMGTREELEKLARFLAAGGHRPLIDRSRPLREARDAFEQLSAGDVFGKLVLRTAS